jgi:signal transduction histidine kinase
MVTDSPSGAVESRTRRWLAAGVGLLWIAQLLPWAPVAWAWQGTTVVVAAYLAYSAWAAVLVLLVLRHRQPGPIVVLVVVLVMTAAVTVVGSVLRPDEVVGWQNWTPPPATGVGVLAAVVGGWRWGAGAVVAVGGTYAATALLRGQGAAERNAVVLAGHLGQLVVFTAVTAVVCELLRRAARAADSAIADAETARAESARMHERLRQQERLHTGALATLTHLARTDGPLTPQLRARCLREADDLRTMVQSAAGISDIVTALDDVVVAQRALGLRIHYDAKDLPRTVPADVVEAVTQATTEALNNVAKHARTDEAWVVADGRDGLRVRVTDRGCGFDPATVAAGIGLTRSLGTLVHDVAGTVRIRSFPGEATTVEIAWSR